MKVFELNAQCKADPFPQKINLTVGAYRDEEGKPWVLPVVRTVEQQMASDETLNKEYLPIDGHRGFTDSAVKLVLGSGSPALVENRCFGFQAISGSGAIRVGLDFLKMFNPVKIVYVSSPTWNNHIAMSKKVGLEVKQYRYFKSDTCGLDFEGMLEDLRNAEEGAIVILHMAAHNPTGVDPTIEEWNQIADVVKEKKLFPFFDSAYQGFATGDLERDAYPARLFVSKGMELFVAQSFSKSFGLYNERAGNLTVVLRQSEVCEMVRGQMKWIARTTWSNCPAHGARIVATVLNNPALYADWKECLQVMSSRMRSSRQLLYDRLRQVGCPGDWSHVLKQVGMFSYTGLTVKQSEYLVKKHHVYMLDGRINICGVLPQNVDYLCKAIKDALTMTTNGHL